MNIIYTVESSLEQAAFIDVLNRSTLSEHRRVDN